MKYNSLKSINFIPVLLGLSGLMAQMIDADPYRLTLEQSTDMKVWTPVEITPEILDGTGNIIWSGLGTESFFRMKIVPGDSLPPITGNMVGVQGGTLAMSMGTMTVSSFQISKYETTWSEWQAVRAQATARGYDIATKGSGCASDHPVYALNWFDVLKWCNLKSEIEGLTPVYTVAGDVYRSGQFFVHEVGNIVWNPSADGYRLPTEVEWEFAARGGTQSNGYAFSGSNIANDVSWHLENSTGAQCILFSGERGTWPVGQKIANELGIHDMSGNVMEWCWDADQFSRRIRGGNWLEGSSFASVAYRHSALPDMVLNSYGFRVARNWGN